ncbi:MAG: glycoside hydrolase family 65 [Oscillospiraceae bacterium]|jgi:hypothetical protein|nr:glycoside hydrolase family 65 [Oscillospiraceae bacterium]
MIDRKTLIMSHNPHYTAPNPAAPLSVGNGDFCFTADATGLQTFADGPVPLCLMAGWGWHKYPDAPGSDSALRLEQFDTFGRSVGYASDHAGQEDLFYALRQNAHKVSLARLGFTLDGQPLSESACAGFDQTLNLWEGRISSRFSVKGEPVSVETFVSPNEDSLCVRAVSPLFANGRLGVSLAFPYGSHKISAADFSKPEAHSTAILSETADRLCLKREMDDLSYMIDLSHNRAIVSRKSEHMFALAQKGQTLEFSVKFAQTLNEAAPSFEKAKAERALFWENYWLKGGAIRIYGTDPRAFELERRVILSQYLVAIQSRGDLPPAETGLTINSWYGKFNVEMHCWHTAHFPLWNRPSALERQLAWYKQILPAARNTAKSQGYAGARWPKLCDASGYNSPSAIAVFLIWQQPHPIMLAELCHRRNKSREFMLEYREVIIETAEFMCSFAHWDGARYVLGAPYIPSQERFDPRTVLNAGFETEYFRLSLRLANSWLETLGEARRAEWDKVADGLAKPFIANGVFPAHENCPETFDKAPFNTDHPSMAAMLGLLPGEGVSHSAMAATLDKILESWDLDSMWGWDFPMLAMTAARLGRPEQAVEFLLMDSPKNTYMANGHNRQGDKADLPLYLPGNAALLLAVAMMAAGWDGEDRPAPGFPADGSFSAEAEGIDRYI